MGESPKSTISVQADDPRLRVMISSTTVDLPEHRQQVRDAIQRMGHTPEMMEFGSAEWNSNAITFSLAKVEQAQIYIGVFALRYGYIPEDRERNPDRLSITELELRHARRLGIPILIYIADKAHPFGEAQIDFEPEKREKLTRLKDGLTKSEICAFFKDAADLRVLVLQSFLGLEIRTSRVAETQETTAKRPRLEVPQPPEVFAVPEYKLTNKFVGRSSELVRLDTWARSSDAIMVVEGIGGLGKSALTWEWMQQRAPGAIPNLAGRVWWSFYLGGASMVTFVRHALAYLTNRHPDELEKDTSHYERGVQLVRELRRRPCLFVLDGFERVLTAYHQLDKARIPDEQVDTALRDCSNPPDGDLLLQLLDCSPSKILMSTRLLPAGLEDRVRHKPAAGVARLLLDGLSPPDALALMRETGVTGDAEEMLDFADQFGRHSLLLRIVCGMVLDYRKQPGDFGAWRADPLFGGGLKLSEVALTERNNHILHFALRGMGAETKALLCRIALLSEDARYETLSVVNPFLPPRPKVVEEPSDPAQQWDWKYLSAAEKAAAQKRYQETQDIYREYRDALTAYPASKDYRKAITAFDAALTELENRGLLQWDRERNRYNMHPVARAYASEQLEAEDRRSTFLKIRDHFQSLPPDDVDHATELAHLSQTLEIYRCLVGAGTLEDAADFYRSQLDSSLSLFLCAHATVLELLKPLFAGDFNGMPVVKSNAFRSWLLNALSFAQAGLGRPEAAVDVVLKTLKLEVEAFEWGQVIIELSHLSSILDRLDRRAEAVAAVRLSQELSEANDDRDGVTVSILFQACYAINQGRFAEAELLVAEFHRRPQPAVSQYQTGNIEIWVGWSALYQRTFSESKWQEWYEVALRHRNVWGQHQLLALRAEWELAVERPTEALDFIDQALQVVNRTGGSSSSYHDLRGCALARLGRAVDARVELQAGEQHRLAAEAYLALGDRALARECALNAYRRAWGEGPPHIHWYRLERSRALLEQLGEPEPKLPAFDPSKVPPIPFETQIRAAIERLQAEKAKRTSQEPDT